MALACVDLFETGRVAGAAPKECLRMFFSFVSHIASSFAPLSIGGTAALDWAAELLATLEASFLDTKRGGYFSSAAEAHPASPPASSPPAAATPQLLLRLKDDYDGAEPAGSSLAAGALVRLAALSGNASWRTAAERVADSFAPRLTSQPLAMPLLAAATAPLAAPPPPVVVIFGEKEWDSTQSLLDAAWGLPRVPSVVPITSSEIQWWKDKAAGGWDTQAAAMVEQAASTMAPGVAVALVCEHGACRPPVTEPGALVTLLQTWAAAQGGENNKGGGAAATQAVDVDSLLRRR